MGSTTHSIEVNAPVSVVYNQWTQFEEFPRFMEGVEEVRQEGDKHLFWRARIGGKEKTWEAQITEQLPDQRIAWQSTSGAPNTGLVAFAAIDPHRTKVTLTLDYEPEGFLEQAGDVFGIPSGRVEGDLKRFRDYLEGQGTETGGWRGRIVERGQVAAGSVPPTGSAAGFGGRSADVSDERTGPSTSRRDAAHPGGREVTSEEVPLTEEQLKVGKRQVDAGEVKIRKVVETERVNVPVELKREDAIIERIPASEVKEGEHDAAFQEGEIRVPLSREEAVVEKETRVTGGVRVRKTEAVEQQTVSDTVRKEDVRLDKNVPGRVVGAENVEKVETDPEHKPAP